MGKFFKLNLWILVIIFMVLDTIFTGIGMGVPVLNIFFGFFIGWFAARRNLILYSKKKKILRNTFLYGLYSSGFTMLLMLFTWTPSIKMLFGPEQNLANFGIPMWLYEPVPSFIGWLVLMVVISPCLQLVCSLSSSYVTFMVKSDFESKGRAKAED